MKTEANVKSEMDFYREISEFSPERFKKYAKSIRLMFAISSEITFFIGGIIFSLLPYVMIAKLSGLWNPDQASIIASALVIIYPFIYYYAIRKYALSSRKDAQNAKRAYDTLKKERGA